MRRGISVAAAGLILWAISRLAGSAGLHLIGIGCIALPALAWWVGARRAGGGFSLTRRLSSHRISVGEPLRVTLSVKNHTHRTSSFLLVEDRLPPPLGGRERFVLDRIPPANTQSVGYTLVPRRRGRYVLPRLSLEVSDPFDLTRARLSGGEPVDLLVAPAVEHLAGMPRGAFGAGRGESLSRQLFLTGEEFYAIREYQTGDDLRRIHWPSVARGRKLMIRQDEASRRASAVLFLDTRASLLGKDGDAPFEKAVSAAASLGALYLANGFSLRMASTDRPPTRVTEESLMDNLAVIGPSGSQRLGAGSVRAASDAATTLLLVSGVPGEVALPPLLSLGAGFGKRVAVLVQPVDRDRAGEGWRRQESRALAVERVLRRAGWEISVIEPSGRLEEVWRHRSTANAS